MDGTNEKKILDAVKASFRKDLPITLKNIMRRVSLDTRDKLSEIIGTTDSDEIKQSRAYLNDSVEVISTDLVDELMKVLDKY